MCRILHLVCLVANLIWIPFLATGSEGSTVRFIDSPLFNFFVAENMTFDSQQAIHVLRNSSLCSCRHACLAIGDRCNAWSVVTQMDSSVECHLANEGPETLVPFSQDKSTYFFKQSSIDGSYSIEADNLMYVQLTELLFHQAAKARCSGIPGHRLIIIKNEKTLDFFRSTMNPAQVKPWPLTDLVKINETYFLWGDGTSYHDTEIASLPGVLSSQTGPIADVFVGTDGFALNDAVDSGGGPFRIICQANIHQIDW